MISTVFCRPLFVRFLAGWCVLSCSFTAPAFSVPQTGDTTCHTPEYRAFDFWAGDWQVVDFGSPTKVADVRVDLIMNGCVLREDYQGMDGHKGQSFTVYDATRKLWHQTWVTNHGKLLQIEGKPQNGEMVLSGTNQQGVTVRGIWRPLDDGVREIAATSADGGKTWKPWFDLMFQRTAQNAIAGVGSTAGNPKNDKEIVAALDEEYQAAVKRNDAATMDRILGEDFILVTSTGKTYTKADLLKEARSARMSYEHQEDTDQTVRVWGDTAVVTANLWEKGTDNGKPFDYKLWFSDVYRRTSNGWKYVFAQSAYRADGTTK